jgi:polo-like kinase 4
MAVTLLTGRPPFDSSAVKHTLDKVAKADYSLPTTLSNEAQDLIRHLLQKVPKIN